MPFDEEEDSPSIQSTKVGLKKVSTQKSIFDGMPKKQTAEEFDNKVHAVQERMTGHKKRAAELTASFNKIMTDKTLRENKNLISNELEKEILVEMMKLAVEINNDPLEQEGMGSLSWIALLFKTCLSQRDRINKLEYALSLLQKKTEPEVLAEFVKKEINKALDSKKISE
jgi:hypothetical protein